MERDAQVHIRVTQDRKNRWQDILEDSNEYRDLTNLIVSAVENELRRGTEPLVAQKESMDVDFDLSSVHERLDDIRENLTEIDSRTERIHLLMKDSEDIDEIATYILDILPEVESEDQIRGRSGEGLSETRYMRETGSRIPLIEHCADQGWDYIDIDAALQRLIDQMETVETLEVESDRDGVETETRFFQLVE